jgi:DNA-directed RNA polymerase subunit L
MDVKVLEREKNSLKVKFEEIDQGILNLIKTALWKNSSTEMAGFRIDHLEDGHPVFLLKTKGKAAKDVWNKTVDGLVKDFDSFSKVLKKI